jgi:hypothetical protein
VTRNRATAGGDASLEYVVNDVCVCEIKRLDGRGQATPGAGASWPIGSARCRRRQLVGELRALVAHYGKDIVGNFDPRVYRFATKVLTPGLGFLFAPTQSVRGGVGGLLAELDSRIQVEGPARAPARAGRARHAGRHADALVEHGLGGDRAGARARRAAAGDLRRR